MSTAIEWTDETWNPVTGCTRVSPGCAHCYIERTPPFRMAGRKFTHGADGATTGVILHPERLEQPLRWRKPRRVFVNSLSDLFHEEIPDEFIVECFVSMALAREHTFQVLTKRPEAAARAMGIVKQRIFSAIDRRAVGERNLLRRAYAGSFHRTDWPLPNVWVGVSIENARYTWRADVLREIPAAVRFISAEPLLGSLFPTTPKFMSPPLDLTGIDWLIVGGESGPGARSMSLEWARELVRACREHDVAPFVKQLGAKPVGGMDVGTQFYLPLKDKKGGDWDEWPEDLRVREFPEVTVAA